MYSNNNKSIKTILNDIIIGIDKNEIPNNILNIGMQRNALTNRSSSLRVRGKASDLYYTGRTIS